jgi:hypothetical protein
VLFFPITTNLPSRFRRLRNAAPIWMSIAVSGLFWMNTTLMSSDTPSKLSQPPIGRFSKALLLPTLREFINKRRMVIEVSRAR